MGKHLLATPESSKETTLQATHQAKLKAEQLAAHQTVDQVTPQGTTQQVTTQPATQRTTQQAVQPKRPCTTPILPWTVVTVFAVALAVRAIVGIHPYSGEHQPPMHGDYEAQRHWMEVALNVPVRDWYTNTTDNDLSYWGLDYPPMSAYVSYAFGKFVQFIDHNAVRLHTSRGYETPRSRAAMRLTVLFADLVLFFPALLLLSHYIATSLSKKNDLDAPSSQVCTLATFAFCLSVPSFILIDHAHFQYNNISLGLFTLSLVFFLRWKESRGACLFCCAIFFKQMTLYYAPAMFFYLLAHVVRLLRSGYILGCARWSVKILTSITLTSLVTFAPWLSSDEETLLVVLRRLFPIARGLYEGKVANVWCSISIIVKIERYLSTDTLFTVCAVFTVLASFPFCVAIFLKPSAVRLLLASAGCALSAFLFSFQVHEKQILIPVLPLAILFYIYPVHATWLSMSATFSLFPLLLREGSGTAYMATIMIHVVTILSFYPDERLTTDLKRWRVPAFFALAVGAALNVLLMLAKAPARAPDMFVLLNTMYACMHFCLIYVSLLQLCFES